MIKNLPANARDVKDVGWILGSGRSPEIGNDNPLQYSCLKNLMGTEAWQTIVHGFAESDTTENLDIVSYLSERGQNIFT